MDFRSEDNLIPHYYELNYIYETAYVFVLDVVTRNAYYTKHQIINVLNRLSDVLEGILNRLKDSTLKRDKQAKDQDKQLVKAIQNYMIVLLVAQEEKKFKKNANMIQRGKFRELRAMDWGFDKFEETLYFRESFTTPIFQSACKDLEIDLEKIGKDDEEEMETSGETKAVTLCHKCGKPKVSI